ncbi:MAG TPA: hypothetical protein VFC11_04265 [Methylocella sp.]|nr:hypothetical protein [Methylocella sp.]
MDSQISKRLAIAIAAKGLNMKAASIAGGLNQTYVRDVIRRNRGKYEQLQQLCAVIGISWDWLRTGIGEMEIVAADRADTQPKTPATGANVTVSRARLTKVLIDAFRFLGADAPEAIAMAGIVLSRIEDRLAPGRDGDTHQDLTRPIDPTARQFDQE